MRYKQFFEYVKYIFPCKYCRISYTEYLEEEPIDVENRKTLTKWLWKIHNKVNEKLEVKYNDASFENVKKRYENYKSVFLFFYDLVHHENVVHHTFVGFC